MEEGGFTLVKRGSRACARSAPSKPALARAVALVDTPPAVLSAAGVARLASQVRECAGEVRASATWAHVARAVDELDVRPERIVCYGIGSPSISHISRYQLGLLLLLRELWQAPPSSEGAAGSASALPTFVFDPILSDADRAIVASLGLRALGASEGRALSVGGLRCLLFMPHCELGLYEAVLSANWASGLPRLWVLGNSLRAYADRVVSRAQQQPTPRLDEAQAARLVRELQVPDRFCVGGVFNNLSLHAFRAPTVTRDDEQS